MVVVVVVVPVVLVVVVVVVLVVLALYTCGGCRWQYKRKHKDEPRSGLAKRGNPGKPMQPGLFKFGLSGLSLFAPYGVSRGV